MTAENGVEMKKAPVKAGEGSAKDAARQFAIDAARLAAATRGHQVVVLDVSTLSPVTDFYVLVTGTSARQMRTVSDQIEEMGLERNNKALSRSGDAGDAWILVDFVDVVVHVFSQEARQYYDLDGLWGDAPRVQWQEQPAS